MDRVYAVLWLLLSWALAFIFVCVSVYDVKRTSPAQFWPWQKVQESNLTDVAAYNQENCTMWMSCAFVFAVNGVVGLFSRSLSMALYTLFLFPGTLLLCQRYNRILRKYIKQESLTGKNIVADQPQRT